MDPQENNNCQFAFDVENIKSRLRNLYDTNTNIDQLAYDVETIFGEHGYRRMSRDPDIIEWIKDTRAYKILLKDDDQLVLNMSNVWMIVLNGVGK